VTLDLGSLALRSVVGLLLCFLLAPIVLVVVFAFNASPYLAFPLQGFSLRWFQNFFASREFTDAFLLSLRLAAATAAIATVIGTMAALVLVRGGLPAADFLSALFLSPLMLPAILTGLALFQFYIILGWPRSFLGLLIAHVIVTVPYIIRTVTAVLQNFDRSLEEAARSLGAAEPRTFFEVTLPLTRPGVIAGAIFAFIVSFDQFPVSLFLIQAGLTTLPIQLFNYLKFNFDPTIAAAAVVSVAMSVVVVLVVEWTVGLQDYAGL
jgi:putative spermidine/putrescine transport system permease protein